MSSKVMYATLLVLLLVADGVSEDQKEEKKTVTLPESNGRVVRVASTASAFAKGQDDRLSFCVFENGAHDLIYVGINHGLWSHGEFDLSFKDKVVYSGKVRYLLYEGMIVDMGDVIRTTDVRDDELKVTRIKGWFECRDQRALINL